MRTYGPEFCSVLLAAALIVRCSEDADTLAPAEPDVGPVMMDAGERTDAAPGDAALADADQPDQGMATDTGAHPLDQGVDIDAGASPSPGCGSVAAQGLEVQSIAPRATDENIRAGDPVHRYVAAVGPRTGRLLVFLPGATAAPADYDDILKNAAAAGDDAIGLAYVNDIRIFVVCGNDPTPDCQESVRIEILRGEALSPHVDVDPADSILNRLVKLLQQLGWTDYLDGDSPRWSRIAVAGHSQGSGHAAMIGRFYSAERTILFAGTEPAPWTRQPRQTPPTRTFAFAHVDDQLFQAFPRSWANLGIPGPPTPVDGAVPPFDGSHQLLTAAPANPDDDNTHRSPIGDTSTPRDTEGRAVYAPIWCFLLGR